MNKFLLALLFINTSVLAAYPNASSRTPKGGRATGITFSVCHYNGSPINYCGAKNANFLHQYDKVIPTFMNRYIPIVLKPSELASGKISKDTRGFLLYDPAAKAAYTFPWVLQTQEATPGSRAYPVQVHYNLKNYPKNAIVFQGRLTSEDYAEYSSSSVSDDVVFVFSDEKIFANIEAQ